MTRSAIASMPPSGAGAPRFRYRPDIDALRGVAVLAVLLFHFNKSWLPGGFTGVDIFFVISGYVVTGSLLNHAHEPLAARLGGFYLRRIRRLLPNLLLCIGLTSMAVAALIPAADNGLFLITGLKSLFAWSNNFLLLSANDYFGSDAERNPFLHTWSLGVEEQFYLVFPLLLAAFGFAARRSLPLLATSVLLSLGLCFYWTQQEPMQAFFLMPSRFWELSAGALLLLAQRRSFARHWPSGRWLRLGGGLVLAWALLFTSESEGFPAPGALPAVLGTLLLIQAGPEADGRFLPLRWLERFLLACGLLSYSLYLWHWPVITLMRQTLGMDLPWQYITAVLLTLLLAGLGYLLVERPVRRHPLPALWQWLLALLAMLFTWFGLDTLLHTYRQRLYLGLSTNPVPIHEWIHMLDPIIPGTGISSKNCSIDAWTPYGPTSRTNFALCSKPGRPGAGEIFLVGDSHAQHLLPMLDRVTAATGQAISFSFKGACLFSPTTTVTWKNKIYETCRQFVMGEMQRSLERLHSGDIIVVSGAFNSYFNTGDPSGRTQTPPAYQGSRRLTAAEVRAAFVADIRRFAAQLAPRGVQLVLVADAPVLGREIADCERWQPPLPGLRRQGLSCALEASQTSAMQTTMMQTLERAAAGLPNVHVFDLTPWLLDPATGQVRYKFGPGRYAYWDSNHLTLNGSRSLAEPFRKFLRDQGLLPANT
ncbi:MAG: acyltransferase family protein [Synechococcaceae cyanobacterium]